MESNTKKNNILNKNTSYDVAWTIITRVSGFIFERWYFICMGFALRIRIIESIVILLDHIIVSQWLIFFVKTYSLLVFTFKIFSITIRFSTTNKKFWFEELTRISMKIFTRLVARCYVQQIRLKVRLHQAIEDR